MRYSFPINDLRLYYLVLAVLLFGTLSCQHDDLAPAPKTDQLHGLFVINEGRWQQNDASISFFNPEADYAAEHYLFSRVNGVRLGDVAHSAVREADTLFVVVNNSRLIYKIQLPSLRLLGQVALPHSASPRTFLRLHARKAYVNSLLDGAIYIIDPVSMQLLPTRIAVENWMEEQISLADKVWVSCGNYAYPDRNNKLAVVDPQTDQLEGYIELPIENPGPLLPLPDGRLLVGLRGNYIVPTSGLAVINPFNRQIDTLIRLEGSLYGMHSLPDGIWIFNDSTVTRFDPQTFTVQYNYLTRERLKIGPRDWLYGAYWDEGRQQYYVCNAENAVTAGSILVLDKKRQWLRSLRAGVLPKIVVVYP